MSFRIITPLALLDENLVASSVAEDVSAEWSAMTTYPAGAYVSVAATHRRYISLQAANTGHDPVTAPTWWQDMGPTNRWAMFDGEISTATEGTTTYLEVKLNMGTRITDVALFGLRGTAVTVTYTDTSDGTVLFEETQELSAVPVIDWTSYWTAPFLYRKEALFTGIPGLATGELKVTIQGDGINTAKCGVCIVGTAVEFGVALAGTKLGFVDYSRRDVDPTFGTVTFTKRDSAKTLELPLEVPGGMLSAVLTVLESVRGVPVVWIPLVEEDYYPAMVYGWMEDSSCVFSEVSVHHYTLMIKGLT